MSNDTISDMLTRIRNAIAVKHRFVIIPKTRMTLAITKVLEKEGYILSYEEFTHKSANENNDKLKSKWPIIAIGLKYSDTGRNRRPVITTLKRVSKPGLRVYSDHKNLPRVLGGFGTAIVSTSRGLITDHKAREEGIGGELLCYIW